MQPAKNEHVHCQVTFISLTQAVSRNELILGAFSIGGPMRSCIQAALQRSRSEKGQILIMAALSMTVLLGVVALATDVGIMLHEKRVLQTAADSAAVAGAQQLGNAASNPGGGSTPCHTSNNNCWYQAAIADAVQNGVPSADVTPHNPPSIGPHKSSSSYVEVIIANAQPTFFMRLFHISSMN